MLYIFQLFLIILLILLILLITIIKSERKLKFESNKFKQILKFTNQSLIFIEINFKKNLVNIINNNKYQYNIQSFCESLDINSNELELLLLNNNENNEIIIKSNNGLKKFKFTGNLISNSIYIGIIKDISSNNELSELKKLKYVVSHDELTGLPNRYKLDEKIKKFCNNSNTTTELCALYFLDLNKFKLINDTYGHQIGDLVLKHVSNQFKAIIDSDVFAIRLCGDEFLIIKRNIENINHADQFINQFTKKVSSSNFKFNSNQDTDSINLPIYFSYGGVVFNKSDIKLSSIIKSADEKMYEMKKRICVK